MVNYLVTGGAGSIGSHIVEALIEDDKMVRVLDDLSTGRRESIAPLLDHVEFIIGDLRNVETVRRAVEDINYVRHQAAIASVICSVRDPIPTETATVVGTLNLLRAARDAGVRWVVYASSASVYGDSPIRPKSETMLPCPPSPYAVSKIAVEHHCRVFTELFGMETVASWYFDVFGPRQDPTSEYASVIPKFIAAMLPGESSTIFGDGTQSRDFTYVSNVVAANLLATTAPDMMERVFDAAAAIRYTLLDLVAALNEIVNTCIESLFGPLQPADVKHSQSDISLIKSHGYQGIDFWAGLQRTV